MTRWLPAFAIFCALAGCGASPAATSTATLNLTATNQPASAFPLLSATVQPTATLLAFATLSATPTATATSSLTPTPTRLPTPTSTLRPTLSPTPTPWVGAVTPVAGATCPFNIAVVVAPPGPAPNGFDWQPVITPLGDHCVSGVAVDPADGNLWYVMANKGLYVTRDGGATWTLPLQGPMYSGAFAIDPHDANTVYAPVRDVPGNVTNFFLSTNRGRSWKLASKLSEYIYALAVGNDGAIYLGPAWGDSKTPNGLFVSRDHGASWQPLPFRSTVQGLICWSIAQDPNNGTLYVGTEIYNHPAPYRPPFYISHDGGKTWRENIGAIPWHVIGLQIDPRTSFVYALMEGPGVMGSSDHGQNWTKLALGPGISLLLDPNHPGRLFGGISAFNNIRSGGALLSLDGGQSYRPIGLRAASASSLALNGDSTKLYVASYASGLYVSPIPTTFP